MKSEKRSVVSERIARAKSSRSLGFNIYTDEKERARTRAKELLIHIFCLIKFLLSNDMIRQHSPKSYLNK